jgi:hypothetical protein
MGEGGGVRESESRDDREDRDGEEGGDMFSGGGVREDVSVDAAGEDMSSFLC